MAGVRFRAGAAAGVFRVDAASLVDRRVGLADVVGSRTARRFADALERGARRRGAHGRLRGARATTGARRRRRRSGWPASSPPTRGRGWTTLAGRAGLSARQLRRRFDRAVGYGPAFFARIARLQRFATVAVRRPELGLGRARRHGRLRRPVAPRQGRPGVRRPHAARAAGHARAQLARRGPRPRMADRYKTRRPAPGARWAA